MQQIAQKETKTSLNMVDFWFFLKSRNYKRKCIGVLEMHKLFGPYTFWTPLYRDYGQDLYKQSLTSVPDILIEDWSTIEIQKLLLRRLRARQSFIPGH